MKTVKIYLKKLIIIFSTLIFCSLLLEVGLRIIGRIPTDMADGMSEQWGDGYRLKKNLKKTVKWPACSFTTYTNSYGFRDKKNGDIDLKEKIYYTILGASDVYGHGVNYEDSFVGILAEEAEKKRIKVLNLGVGGHRFPDQEALFKDFLKNAPHKPLKLLFTVNAMNIHEFDRPNNDVIVKNGYLLDKNHWIRAYIRLMLGNNSSAYCYFRDGIRKIQEEWFNFKPTKELKYFRYFSKSNRMYSEDIIRQFEDYLNNLEDFCRQNNIELIYIYLPMIDSYRLEELVLSFKKDPNDFDASYYSFLMEMHCKKEKIPFLNLRPVLKTYHEQGKELRFKLDGHYNKFANRIVGNYLAEKILQY
jgi:hypothetical protein